MVDEPQWAYEETLSLAHFGTQCVLVNMIDYLVG